MTRDSDLAAPGVGRRTHPATAIVLASGWSLAIAAALAGSLLQNDGLSALAIGLAVAGGIVVGTLLGLVLWWFTRYVIDETEVRLETGVLVKNSRRVPFARLQSVDIVEPLVARLFGLAELRLDSAGGKKARTTVRYLPVSQARELRRLLMARAGMPAPADESPEPRPDDAPPLARAVVAEVPVERVVIGTVLSLDFVSAILVLVATIVAAIWFSQPLAVLGGVLATGSWVWQIIVKRVVSQWGYRLTRVEHGLRIERGLLTRTSQTIPFDRVQGVAVVEPLVWRRYGWRRIEVDVAGSAGQSDGDRDDDATVLPITDPATAAIVIDQLVPGAVEVPSNRTGAAQRGWPFAPIGWRYRWIGADAVAIVSRRGWITRRTSIVAHRKTQSVEVRQGPLQRRLGVATIEVHSPDGPVDVDGPHLLQGDATMIAEAQVIRARAAR